MIRRCVLFAVAAAVFAQDRSVRMTAGEATLLHLDARLSSLASTRTEPALQFPPLVRLDESGDLRIIVPPATARGNYRIYIEGGAEAGRASSLAVALTVDAVTVPSTGKTPVILMNGWQFSCSGNLDSTVAGSVGTFGQLASLLQSDGIPVVFFNNCVYGQDVPIETLASQLNSYIATLTYADGTPVTQVDLITHSMGGLIARAYLAGLQSNGSISPALSPSVRKMIELATPNFGSFQAHLFNSTQTSEMAPGSAFLWNLATWNQRMDDLRGVDALAVIGNAGPIGSHANQSDGLVSLTSGSLGFARPDQRTRIVPYCHVTASGLISSILNCGAHGIADIDSPSHLSAQIVRSFLAGTPDWQSIGTPPSQNQYLSQFGGVYFAEAQTNGAYVNDLTQVSFGSTTLSNGGDSGTVFYNEFLSGSGTFQAVSASQGAANCGSFTEPAGYYSVYRCKQGPQIFSVGPFAAGALARVVPSGRAITISGVGFGAQCSSCSLVMNSGAALTISSWTDQAITATLPLYSGGAQITVNASGGSDSIGIFASAPGGSVLITSITNGASSAAGSVAPGELVTIKGSGLGPAVGVSYSVNSGMIATNLAGVSVTFGTIAAPVLYASATQVNVVAPYEIAGQPQVAIQVSYSGNSSAATSVQIVNSAPGAFTMDSSGSGQALAFYMDYTFNSASHAAPQGANLMLYFTGGGQTNPPGTTGGVNGSTLKNLPTTTATVGGVPATVTFSGAAPSLVDGISQLNIQLGPNTPSGAQPLVITVNGVSSPSTATIAVQ